MFFYIMESTSKITVVTVTYNAEKVLEKTIQSVINQTYANIEYIIIDGASKDNTMDIVNKYRDRISIVVSEPDKGIYDAMNKGIRLATGDWINFMNAGDSFAGEDVMEKFISQIDPLTIIAYGDANMLFHSSVVVWRAFPLHNMKERMPFCHQTVFVKTIYHREHPFDISYRLAGDYNFFYKSYFDEHVKFQHIALIVSNFDASDGLSTVVSLRLKENARLKGTKRTVCWYIKFYMAILIHYIKQFVKFFLPQSVIEKKKQKSLDKYSNNSILF